MKTAFQLLPCFLAWITVQAASITEWPLDLRAWMAPADTNGPPQGPPVVDPPFYSAGFVPLNDTKHGELFYYYFQERSRDPDAPLLFWTNGGPGCSSLYGLFSENGPFAIQEDLTLRYTEYGWDQGANILFVEQPVGTGFSESSDDADYARLEDTVGENMLMFFLKFMEIHPELKEKDLFLSGESYGGHYLPAIARALLDANKSGKYMHLNLKGVLVGDPWTAPLAQSFAYPTFGVAHGLISQEEADVILKNSTLCTEQYWTCNTELDLDICSEAAETCYWTLFVPVLQHNPNMNVYDIRKENYNATDAYDESLLYKFLNSPVVQEQLGVHARWQDCSDKVASFMAPDTSIDMTNVVKSLVNEGLRFLVYAGDKDFICNLAGQKAWIDPMDWNKADQWTGVMSQWKIETKSEGLIGVGDCETVLPLSLCSVYNSGHMVPADQPEVAYNLMRTFIAGGTFVPQKEPMRPKTIFATQ